MSKLLTTGKLPLDLRAWFAIISLSLVVNLPGLAVTPMLDTLSHIFPGTTTLEKQLLTVCPNLFIIPFVLMSGKLSTTPRKKELIFLALLIIAGSTVGYFFSTSMAALIIFSCTLGIGAGLLIPFSTGLLSDTFAGQPLMRQMGLQSAISNLTLVCATFAVGWLAAVNWHMPFLVYGVCLIPMLMIPFLNLVPKQEFDPREADKEDVRLTPDDEDATLKCNAKGFDKGRVISIFAAYFLITLGTMSLSEYLPFLVAARNFPASITGTMTSIFFLLVFLGGFFLTDIVKVTRIYTIVIAISLIVLGMACVAFVANIWWLGAGVILTGIGYGVCQPLIYNKATLTVCKPSLKTQALSIALSANYSAIVIEPFITQGICKIFRQQVASAFPFVISFFVCVLILVLTFVYRHNFITNVSPSYWTKPVAADSTTTTQDNTTKQ